MLILATDGFFDNVWKEQAVSVPGTNFMFTLLSFLNLTDPFLKPDAAFSTPRFPPYRVPSDVLVFQGGAFNGLGTGRRDCGPPCARGLCGLPVAK